MNIRGNHRTKKMNLEQALLKYGNDIVYLVLRDGTYIEIIDDFPNVNEDEFVEEKFENENYGYNNYIYKEIDQNGTLRGKGLKKNNNAGKPLRKTILKSSINDEGKLRSNAHENNEIIKHSENNEYLQCANCFKFFNAKEDEDETDNTSNTNYTSNSNNNNKNQIQPQQYNNNINNNNNNKNIRPQIPFPNPPMQNNQQYIPNQPNIPRQVMPPPPQQKYNQNYPNNNNPPYYQQNQGKYPPPPYYQQIPRGPPQRMNIPQPYYNNNNPIPKGNMRIPFNYQQNQIFRERKRNSGRYQQIETKSEFIQKNYVVNKYPGSAKKPRNVENEMINQEIGYTDNNMGNYLNENEIKYYNNPPPIKYQTKNFFVHSSSKRIENNNYYQPEVGEFQENDYYGY